MCKRCGKGVAQDGTEELKRCRDARSARGCSQARGCSEVPAIWSWSFLKVNYGILRNTKDCFCLVFNVIICFLALHVLF